MVKLFYLRQSKVKINVRALRMHSSYASPLMSESSDRRGDSSPLAAEAVIQGPFSHTLTSGLGELLIGEDSLRTEYSDTGRNIGLDTETARHIDYGYTVERFYYEIHHQLRCHVDQFVAAYNFARRLKTLKAYTLPVHLANS